AGVPIDPPVEFTRPVEVDGKSHDARFRTVRMKAGVVPYGRVYYCHHFTRDLVWRDEWRHHANGTVAVARMTIVEPAPDKAAQLYRDMFGADAVRPIEGGQAVIVGNARIDILTANALAAQVGANAMPDAAGRNAYMAGLAFRTTSLARAAKVLEQGAIPCAERGGRLVVPAHAAMNAVIEFVE
ncbi:MAG: VOC family protein, partial [Hyphomicrobiaceae bacterium]